MSLGEWEGMSWEWKAGKGPDLGGSVSEVGWKSQLLHKFVTVFFNITSVESVDRFVWQGIVQNDLLKL